jgi:putative NIF3 family GTP cyclohydrolase 1 type 2
LFTGELGHHYTLAAIEQGKCVITTFHSNTERAFLRARMQPALMTELELIVEQEEMDEMMDREAVGLAGGFEVSVSEVDRDPFEIVAPGQTGW